MESWEITWNCVCWMGGCVCSALGSTGCTLRFSPYSGCVGHAGSQWVCGAECPCQKSNAGLLHVTVLFARPGSMQVIETIMLCVFLGCDVACRQFKSAVIIHSSCWSCCLLQEGLEALKALFLPALQGCSAPSGSPHPRQSFPV